ncbi:unnamed protein product [Vicia faba]|uniref:TIR domain-containing protein n=1 Tax=Vicia faba TaxID=3906 RepID=A0AAV1AB39_VICFA|nr:unnamed protein product [Vicia faba]
MSKSSSSSSSTTPKETHEVFLSFRGDDTRKKFTSHLNSALRRLDIKTYIDDNLERGDEISHALLKAIEEAKLSVIVFSKNYANSKWCLDEVVKILECRKSNRQVILPVFYEVDPFHVRHQRGSYAEAFAKHEERYANKMNMVQKWRDALGEAANTSGWDSLSNINRTESELVEEIAKDVMQKLNYVDVSDLSKQITKLEQLAELQLQYYKTISNYRNKESYEATVERITELKMIRSIRMLRLEPEMISYMEGSEAYERFF